MENTALNGTTNATKDQEWKTKKGYGPIIVALCLALLLGLSLYAGGPYDGDSLRRNGDNIVDGIATSAVQDGAGHGDATSNTCWEYGKICSPRMFKNQVDTCVNCCNSWHVSIVKSSWQTRVKCS